MNIRIKRIELTNFKCFRHKEITFDSDITTIRGRNGVGKTTIADAVLFCLFGKNTAGQSDLELFKTREGGKVIPNLDHSVEMELELWSTAGTLAQGLSVKTVTLRRSIKEVWVKKRGSDESVFKNNTCEYFVNGESCTQADFKKYIDKLVSEDIFRAITNPKYFLSQKWQVQRDFLARMVGSIEPEAIADTDELAALVRQLDDSNDDIISYRKHLSYQIKQIKEKLDRIPVRLEEQNKALPDKLDWDALQVQYTDVSRQSQELSEKIIAIRSGNGGDVLREEIRNEIRAIRSDMEKVELEVRTQCSAIQAANDKAVSEARQKFNSLVASQRDLEASIPSLVTLAKRCRDNAGELFRKEQEFVRSEWPKTQVSFDSQGADARCALCGQLLPPDQIDAAREKFNTNRAELRRLLTERANKAKQLLSDAETEAKGYEERKADYEKRLAEVNEQINAAFSEKQRLERQQLPTVEQALSGNVRYTALSKQLSEAQAKLASVTADEDTARQLSELESRKAECEKILAEKQAQLATRQQYDRIQQLIAGIHEEQKSLMAQLSELERKEDVACQYQDRQNAILEERVNQRFRLVKWRMFRTVNNGGDPVQEPYCECLVDGIPYGGGLNKAARLNAGLDIIDTMCKHYNVSAPILLDNAESVNNILQTIGQQIRLYVSEDEYLTAL